MSYFINPESIIDSSSFFLISSDCLSPVSTLQYRHSPVTLAGAGAPCLLSLVLDTRNHPSRNPPSQRRCVR